MDRIINISRIPTTCLSITMMLSEKGYDSFLVGGCVRDMLLKIEPKDYDFCTNAKVKDVKEILEEHNVFYTTVGEKFGTIVAHMDGSEYEITTYRKEGEYTDKRRPNQIIETNNLDEDLARRDFTINAIAYSILDSKIHDPFNGISDLDKGIIRTVGDANKRFDEDALRILRGVRFASRFDFDIEENTLKAMKEKVDGLDLISKERITDEFRKMFNCDTKYAKVFKKTDFVIAQIIPEIKETFGCTQNNRYHYENVWEHSLTTLDNVKSDSNKFVIKMAALLHDIGKPKCKIEDENGFEHFYGHPEASWEITKKVAETHFCFTRKEKEELLELVRYHDTQLLPTEKSINRFIREHGEEFLTYFLSLKQADFDAHAVPEELPKNWIYFNRKDIEKAYQTIKEQSNCFKIKDLDISGNDLIKLGIRQGPQIGEILNEVFNEVSEGNLTNHKNDIMYYVRMNLFNKYKEEVDFEY